MGEIISQRTKLNEAALTGNWSIATEFLDSTPNAISQPITWCLEMALMVAIRSDKRNFFVENLIERTAKENIALLEKQDILGATALHAAVHEGKIAVAKWLVEVNPGLVNISDNYGTMPVHVAAGLKNKEMVLFLLGHTRNLSKDESSPKLLHFLVSGKHCSE